jgi:uncharacterized protein (TIGR02217 family)
VPSAGTFWRERFVEPFWQLQNAPTLGVEITADFEFDVPVRFDTDHMAVTIETYQLHNWQQIPIVELRI